MRLESSTTDIRHRRRDWLKTQWANNHVNFILAFVGMVLLVNVVAVAYLQSKFVPIKFPDARAFTEGGEQDFDSQAVADGMIGILVLGAVSDDGVIVIRISDSQASFDKTSPALIAKTLPLIDEQATCQIDPAELPESFAITAFHDADQDGEITVNKMGVPIERYGFSGRHRFIEPNQPPSFEDVKIQRPPAGETLNLFIR